MTLNWSSICRTIIISYLRTRYYTKVFQINFLLILVINNSLFRQLLIYVKKKSNNDMVKYD